MKKIFALVAVGSLAVTAAHAQSAEQESSSRTAAKQQTAVQKTPAVQPLQNTQRIDMRNAAAQPAPAAPVRAVNADLESKRLPANYPNPDNRTSKSDQ